MAALHHFMSRQVLTNVISRTASTSDWLANLFGVASQYVDHDDADKVKGGDNVLDYGHSREGAYHIFNNVQEAAAGRAPGTAAHRRAPQPMGKVLFTYPRMHDSVPLLSEVIDNLGRMDDPARHDVAGRNMIKRQTRSLADLAKNWRKQMLVGTLRDSLYMVLDGDSNYFSFTSPSKPNIRIRSHMPDGNKTNLDMLGGGGIINASWAVDSTDIPFHLGSINAAFQQLCGGHLAAVIVGHKVWNAVINNDHVAKIHGSANPPFVMLDRHALDPVLARTMKNVYMGKLSVFPDVTWYITDEIMRVGAPGAETTEKLVGENQALFIGHEPDDGTVSCYLGSEMIAEYDNGEETRRVGLSSWSVKRANPTSTDLFVLDNSLTVNHIPASHAYGTVIT